ncbi:MAG TPA: hypothetical protein VFF53_01140 [Geobacteraceae bacterium]|nr:hypothetical protein [Geobacteraceae bacterium]
MKKLVSIAILAVIYLLQGNFFPDYTGHSVARAGESGWRTEFDELCGQSENSMNMTAAELRNALEKCDALKAEIEKLEATPRKIYLKRLQMCRNLFSYMLENKLKEEQK